MDMGGPCRLRVVVHIREVTLKCLNILVGILVVLILTVIVLASVVASPSCGEENGELPVPLSGDSDAVVHHEHKNVGINFDNSHECCQCPSWAWSLLELFMLTALLTFTVNTGRQLMWRIFRQLLERTKTHREGLLNELRVEEEKRIDCY